MKREWILKNIMITTLISVSLALSPLCFADQEFYQRDVEMAWDPVDGAVAYDVEVSRSKDDGSTLKPAIFTVQRPQWKAFLRVGTYNLRIRSRDDRNVPGDWSDPTEITVNFAAVTPLQPQDGQKLITNETNEAPVTFSWQPIIGAKNYLLHIINSQGITIKTETVSDSQTKKFLHVGENYRWSVQALSERLGPGLSIEKLPTFSLRGGPLAQPGSLNFQMSDEKKLKWTWKADEFETNSKARLDKINEIGKLQRFDQNTSTFLGEATSEKVYSPGFYKVQLQSRNPLRLPSPVTTRFLRIDDDGRIYQGDSHEDVKFQPLRLQGWSVELYGILKTSSVEGEYPDLETTVKAENNSGWGAEGVLRRISKNRRWSQSLEAMYSQVDGAIAGGSSYKINHHTFRLMNDWSFYQSKDYSKELRLKTGLGYLISHELHPDDFNTAAIATPYSLVEAVLGFEWTARVNKILSYSLMLLVESSLHELNAPNGFEEFGGGHLQSSITYQCSKKLSIRVRLNARGQTINSSVNGASRKNNLDSAHFDLGVLWNL